MPKMGESITEGTIINWTLKEGDSFDEGDILLEVATDKVDNEVPASTAGILKKILFQAQEVVPVGEVLAILEVSESRQDSDKEEPLATTKTDLEVANKAREKKKREPGILAGATRNNNTFFSPLIIKYCQRAAY